jgi:hypothetical protein
MSYSVKPGNLLGRIGTGFGQGLAEQIPKEIERHRLASGLQKFQQQSVNQSPIQQLAQLAAIPGITPQMIQSFGELAKQQGIRNSFSRNQKQAQPTQQFASEAAGIPFAGINPNAYRRQLNEQEINPQAENPEIQRGQPLAQNQINPQNPLAPQFQTIAPWTPEKRNNEIGKYWDEHPNLTFDQVQQAVSDQETRELAQPEAVRAENQRLEDIRSKLVNSFRDKLSTKLQKNSAKEGEIPAEIYKDITGENLVAIERAMDKELATNPNANIDDVADKWSTKALELAKTKSQMKTLEKGSLSDFLSFKKYGSTYEKLKQYQKIFSETGNDDEFFQNLKSDFLMSPQGAASIAYPPTKSTNEYINKIKPSGIFSGTENARKRAYDIIDSLGYEDSLLSIARLIKEKDPNFDQYTFFKEIGENREKLRNDRQKRELAEGEDVRTLPAWGDLWVIPPNRGKK